ncbi:MAG: diaminopimelate epimerase [Anaerosomatales bacterium]|nr:diaminopimelate epimerase [Anaerosomatales bacterium]MDT8433350.1 diaminopimelate epimerase [Anaerosomatales bacterium]
MLLEFTKMHGLGNDFIMVEDLDEALDLAPEAVAWFCHRNFGIGADGVILVRPSSLPDADFFMLYYNADGTPAEMCGNGIRCLAKFVVDRGLVDAGANSVRVQTLGGIKPITFSRDAAGLLATATVVMGEPVFEPARIPVALPGERAIDHPITTDAGEFTITAVSMGNPHAIIWVDDVDSAPVRSAGPLIETDPLFPAKTNVEFAQPAGRKHIRLRVWERGVGETLACGTGACATLVAGVLAGHTDREATIELPGGELSVRWGQDGRVYMTGPAVEVFRGSVKVPDEAPPAG